MAGETPAPRGGACAYNEGMARGWESKSITAQIDEAESLRSADPENIPAPEMLELIRKKETILLSRIRVVRDLKSVQNPRYKAQLNKALQDLNAQLATIASG
jgi:hypothetical protein